MRAESTGNPKKLPRGPEPPFYSYRARGKKAYEGDFNVSNAVCHFAGNVAAGFFRVPRCRWADSPSVNNSGDFFSGLLRQGS